MRDCPFSTVLDYIDGKLLIAVTGLPKFFLVRAVQEEYEEEIACL